MPAVAAVPAVALVSAVALVPVPVPVAPVSVPVSPVSVSSRRGRVQLGGDIVSRAAIGDRRRMGICGHGKRNAWCGEAEQGRAERGTRQDVPNGLHVHSPDDTYMPLCICKADEAAYGKSASHPSS
jgi:hypothetical protein